jgi:hypothetical protein
MRGRSLKHIDKILSMLRRGRLVWAGGVNASDGANK